MDYKYNTAVRVSFISIVIAVVWCNVALGASKPQLEAFECRKEFNVGVPSFDGLQITTGRIGEGVIKNFILKDGTIKDGYPKSYTEGYHTLADKEFALVFFSEHFKKHGITLYRKIAISFSSPLPESGKWSKYYKGILSEASVSAVLESADTYNDQPEKCRVKIAYE